MEPHVIIAFILIFVGVVALICMIVFWVPPPQLTPKVLIKNLVYHPYDEWVHTLRGEIWLDGDWYAFKLYPFDVIRVPSFASNTKHEYLPMTEEHWKQAKAAFKHHEFNWNNFGLSQNNI